MWLVKYSKRLSGTRKAKKCFYSTTVPNGFWWRKLLGFGHLLSITESSVEDRNTSHRSVRTPPTERDWWKYSWTPEKSARTYECTAETVWEFDTKKVVCIWEKCIHTPAHLFGKRNTFLLHNKLSANGTECHNEPFFFSIPKSSNSQYPVKCSRSPDDTEHPYARER